MKESEHETTVECSECGADLNTMGSEKVWDHLMLKGHKVADLEQIEHIKLKAPGGDILEFDILEFETWCCMNKDCNYLEFRLKEGHREDR